MITDDEVAWDLHDSKNQLCHMICTRLYVKHIGVVFHGWKKGVDLILYNRGHVAFPSSIPVLPKSCIVAPHRLNETEIHMNKVGLRPYIENRLHLIRPALQPPQVTASQ